MKQREGLRGFSSTLWKIATIIALAAAITIWLALENRGWRRRRATWLAETIHQMALDSKEASATQLGVQTWLEIQQRFRL